MADLPTTTVRPYDRLLHAAQLHADEQASVPRPADRPLAPEGGGNRSAARPRRTNKKTTTRGAKK